MKIKVGYKSTEVGVIPTDWDVMPLSEVLQFRNGKAHEQHIVRDGKYIVVNSKFISTEGEVRKYSDECFCPTTTGETLFVMSDLPNGRALAKCFIVDADDRYAVNQRICSFKPRKGDPKYFFYTLNRNPYFLSFDDGVQQTHLLNAVILNCPVKVPPTEKEQRAIAKALSDMDALINSLDALLAKKRLIKQGTMQQLLTGKKRLPGFSGDAVSDRSKQTEVGEFPTDWWVPVLGDLVDKSRSIRYGIVQPGKYDPKGRFMVRGQDYSKGWVAPSELFRVSDPVEERYWAYPVL